MSYVRGDDRGQAALLPAAIEDYVAADAPVRVIDAFVDGLDVKGLGFGDRCRPQTGRPPYDPRDLLKLYVYGYLNECARRVGWSVNAPATSRRCGFCVGWRPTSRRLPTSAATMAQRSSGTAGPSCCSAGIRACSRRGGGARRLEVPGRSQHQADYGPARDRGRGRPSRRPDRRLSGRSGCGRRPRT